MAVEGYGNDSSVNNVGNNGNVWSRSLNRDNSNNAYYLYFNSDNANRNNNNRYNGYSVRGILVLINDSKFTYRLVYCFLFGEETQIVKGLYKKV